MKRKFPQLQELPKAKLRLVEEALIYASELTVRDDLLSDREHAELMEKIGGKRSNTPGDSLRAYRLRQDLNQSDLARKSGIPQANISAMENGKRPIGLNIAKKLADILNCDYRKLV
ncbi:MAG: helix-turn-helix transcriptional regulator [Bdellovibrionales bacterium]|nr:helix-turn-helix transcriptional regulator [Bdellovibrionales bacterium]